jgi:predicted dehydrogenase
MEANMKSSDVSKHGGLPTLGVLGVGSLGKEHARIYGALASEGLIRFGGVYDTLPAQAREHAAKHGTRAFDSVDEAIASCDALSVVTPTVTHAELAMRAMQAGRHVLVEKPMTDTAATAEALVALARERGVVLQVGHVERFNPVFQYLDKAAMHPRFIECHRLSPYPKRSTDIGVVLDLMIHDLDVVLAFVKSPLLSVEAVGIPVLSRSEDIANARLRFADGCVANLTASRISPERVRKVRVFSGGEAPSYVSLDYRAQEGFVYRLAGEGAQESSLLHKLLRGGESAIISEHAGRKIVREPVPISKEEPLACEIRHFVECVRERRSPRVSGEQAKAALDVAFEIIRQIGRAGRPEDAR